MAGTGQGSRKPTRKPNTGQKAKSSSSGSSGTSARRRNAQGQAPAPRRSGSRQATARTFNIGVGVFLIIIVYVLYSLFRYLTAKHVAGYEVRTGSLSENNVYMGLALREEQIEQSEYAGYVNFYNREKERLSTGSLSYTVDESGEVAEAISYSTYDNSIFTSSDYRQIQGDIAEFVQTFQPTQFENLYSFKDNVSLTILKAANTRILSEMQGASGASSVHYCNTKNTGYIVYSVDGYEGRTFDDITHKDFDTVSYRRTDIASNQILEAGDPVYKLETAEDWSIVIELPDEAAARELEELGVIQVRFLKNQLESWATVTIKNAEGRYFANLAFTNSMITFCTDRFISVELLTDTTSGLKIPLTALVDDNFYVIPSDYIVEGTGGSTIVLRQITDENGELTTQSVTLTVYGTGEDGSYYVDKTSLRSGDVLVRLDSNITYTVQDEIKLTGVYNINKGYADFRQVNVIRSNDEFAIVQPDSVYGLREYDYIVLDAQTMSPDEFLFE